MDKIEIRMLKLSPLRYIFMHTVVSDVCAEVAKIRPQGKRERGAEFCV